ncbi:unnamed protein product, partial [Prunus brigantina]
RTAAEGGGDRHWATGEELMEVVEGWETKRRRLARLVLKKEGMHSRAHQWPGTFVEHLVCIQEGFSSCPRGLSWSPLPTFQPSNVSTDPSCPNVRLPLPTSKPLC